MLLLQGFFCCSLWENSHRLKKLACLTQDSKTIRDILKYTASASFKQGSAPFVDLGPVSVVGPVPTLPYEVHGILRALLLPCRTCSRWVCRRVTVFAHQNGASSPGLLSFDDGWLVGEGQPTFPALHGLAWSWARWAGKSSIDALSREECYQF